MDQMKMPMGGGGGGGMPGQPPDYSKIFKGEKGSFDFLVKTLNF